MTAFEDRLPDLDAAFERARLQGGIPGVAWGVVREGRLVHAGGSGTLRDGDARRPDADSVFRIASMTKSFTASAVLLLRDENRLGLDDPVADHVPALAGWPPPTADTTPVTIRQLLTMSGGLPTDDPWGDRQQGLPLDEFETLLRGGPTFAWPPGTTFEYSNLGYGILGRVITSASGTEYRDFVHDRLLVPLGMPATVFDGDDVPDDRLAHGYARLDDRLVREGTDAYGALAAMGGIFTSVRDLATWIAGFLDAFPARDDPDGGHPLRRASRREQQQVHRLELPSVPAHAAHAAPHPAVVGYGYGLEVRLDLALGTFVAHGGGYPGFGSFMAWHPASGVGVVGLGNLRYAPLRVTVTEQLGSLVASGAMPRRRVTPSPAVRTFRPIVERLLAAWDDAVADAAFAMNMDLDEPRERRRAAVERIASELGPFGPAEGRDEASVSPSDLSWWLRGTCGWAHVEILVTPEREPRIQKLSVTAVHDPSAALRGVAESLLAACATPVTAWPPGVATGPDLDVATVERSMRAASARFGPMRLGRPMAGDGTTTATWEVDGDDGRAELSVTVDAASGAVTAARLAVPEIEAPSEPW